MYSVANFPIFPDDQNVDYLSEAKLENLRMKYFIFRLLVSMKTIGMILSVAFAVAMARDMKKKENKSKPIYNFKNRILSVVCNFVRISCWKEPNRVYVMKPERERERERKRVKRNFSKGKQWGILNFWAHFEPASSCLENLPYFTKLFNLIVTRKKFAFSKTPIPFASFSDFN